MKRGLFVVTMLFGSIFFLAMSISGCAVRPVVAPAVTYQQFQKELVVNFTSVPSGAEIRSGSAVDPLCITPCDNMSAGMGLRLVRRVFTNGRDFILLTFVNFDGTTADSNTIWANWNLRDIKSGYSSFQFQFAKADHGVKEYELKIMPDQLPYLWDNPTINVSVYLD